MELFNQVEYWKQRALKAEKLKNDYKHLAEKSTFMLQILIDNQDNKKQQKNKFNKANSSRRQTRINK